MSMRTLFVMSVFTLLLSACSSVESLKEPVENLTKDWENTTTMVSDFVNDLQSTQQALQNQFAEMTVPEGLTLSEASENRVAELKDGYQEELGSLTDLSGEVSNFISGWQAKAAKLTELKTGLESSSLGTDAMATVEDLQGIVAEGKDELESWQGELADIRENTSDVVEQFHTLMANLQGN